MQMSSALQRQEEDMQGENNFRMRMHQRVSPPDKARDASAAHLIREVLALGRLLLVAPHELLQRDVVGHHRLQRLTNR